MMGNRTKTEVNVMHAIYFRWKVSPGHEREFERAWSELTHLIRDERGGLGSRLHRCADGHYFAYAQWPSEAHWLAQAEPSARMVELRNHMRDIAELIDGPLRGDVVMDLLVPAPTA
jgi:heme-degrading monooxygenase HmoA